MWIPFPTPESIAAARNAMLAERAAAMSQIGGESVVIRCPRCLFEVEGFGFSPGQAEGKAVGYITKHLIEAHQGAA